MQGEDGSPKRHVRVLSGCYLVPRCESTARRPDVSGYADAPTIRDSAAQARGPRASASSDDHHRRQTPLLWTGSGFHSTLPAVEQHRRPYTVSGFSRATNPH